MSETNEITRMLQRIGGGDQRAWDELVPRVYATLHELAHRVMSERRGNEPLQTTALVHEAFLKMAGGERRWNSRQHFERVAARAMRCVLVDNARERNALKRGGNWNRALLTEEVAVVAGPGIDVLALDEAMDRLKELDAESAEVAELHCFGGLGHDAIARILDRSPRTIARVWRFARAWLERELDSHE